MPKRPNILFFFSDQHSPHVTGFGGNDTIDTPSLDRLAAEGVVFDNAYCQNPLCVPSRCSVVTGRYCRNIGIYDNQHILEQNCATFPRVLSAAGYRTCLIGKAHFNGEQFHGYQQRPYGDFYGQAHQPDPGRMPEKGPAGLGGVIKAAGPSGIPLPLTQTEICVAEASKWLQCHAGLHGEQPFCLSVNFDKPHFPICPPPHLFNKYVDRVKLPAVREGHLDRTVPFARKAIDATHTGYHHFEPEAHLKTLAAYYGCVDWVDDAIGRILSVLEYLGLDENTIVIYSTDHGEMGGEHGTWQKTLFYEASARVPLIVRWPGKATPGHTVEAPVGLIDLFPTMCEVAGIETPESCDGVSLTPVLSVGNDLGRDAIFSESTVLKHPTHAGCMIRTGNWKYAYYMDGAEELYNLDTDPDEWDNLAGKPENTDLQADLRRRVIDFWEPDKQIDRFNATPSMAREKHFYEYSNQFMLGDGTVVDARP